MRRYLYLSTAVAGVVMTAGAGASFAQCVTTQNCAELGYTETSCPDGTGLKCPFGDTFACTGGSCATDCAELGFTYPCTNTGEQGVGKPCGGKYQSCSCKSPYILSNGACSCPSTYKYACTGTNQTGGSGEVCSGKYTKCTCKSTYGWNNGSCQYKGEAKGDLYYCNGKIVGVKAGNMNFYISIKSITPDWDSGVNKAASHYTFCGYLTGKLPTEAQLKKVHENRYELSQTLLNLPNDEGWRLSYKIYGPNGREGAYFWSSTPGNEKNEYKAVYVGPDETFSISLNYKDPSPFAVSGSVAVLQSW